ncbi:MAG TPA: TIGR03016 family PEP-CTERM system-associated outer membrane protein [Rhodocyclaceae bacterium]|nr:TIGR03016 family PEP-CTERM system-associated outer membrane protein [Rhodocyclaceae bacterium]HUY02628.1 TIGR03016 family PEP-CTERM system-associated outer membrane protein [Rhodocyclaceae bacterium]
MHLTETANRKNLAAPRYAMAILLSAGISASFPARADSWTFTPHLEVQGSYSDNVALAAPGQERGDTILGVSPGIAIHGDGARVKLNFDYTWQNLTYLDHSSNNTSNNMLSANANVEAVENWFYIDATAGVSQQNVSAFGPQPVDNISITGNRTSVSSYSVSPYIKGVVGSDVAYQLRHNTYGADSGDNQLPRSQSNEWVGTLNGGTPLSVLNWGVDYNRASTDYEASASAETETVRGSLYFRVAPELSLSVNAGHEKNNFLVGKQSGGTHGFGFQWTPGERTSFAGERDQRLFGPGYSFLFKHRMPMSALDVALTRDLTTSSTVLFRGLGTTLAQLVANALPPPPAGAPDNRLALATTLLGPSANLVPTLGFLTNQIVLQKRLQASYALIGARNMLTFTAFRADSQSVAPGFSASTNSAAFVTIDQKGLSVTWSHTLSGLSSANTSYARTLSTGDGIAGQSSTQNSLSVNLTTKLSPKTNGSFGLRHVVFDGVPSGYHENAIYFSLSFLF